MADSSIRIENLKQATNNIKNDTNEINDLYNNTISKALEGCREDLIVSGVNFDEIQTSFKNLFTTLTSQLNELTSAMDSSIIPKYEATASTITKLFNQDFASEMNDFLKIINSD